MSLTRLYSRAAFRAAAVVSIIVLCAAPAGADPVLVVSINDTMIVNDSTSVWVDVFLTNTSDSVAGFEMTIMLDNPDLIEFFGTGGNPTIDTVGTLISGWGLVMTNYFGGSSSFKIAALATYYPQPPVQCIAPRTEPGLLFRMKMGIFPYTPGRLPDRNTILMISDGLDWTGFSNEIGTLIGTTTIVDTSYRYWDCIEWQGDTCLNWEQIPWPEGADSTSIEIKPRTILDTALTHYEDGTVRVVPECHGECGDANGDGLVNIADAVYIITYVFRGGLPPFEDKCADANNDYSVNVGDAIYLVNYVFRQYTAPECTPHW